MIYELGAIELQRTLVIIVGNALFFVRNHFVTLFKDDICYKMSFDTRCTIQP